MIVEKLPSTLRDFLSEIESLGFSLVLVGGAPRDFLHSSTIGNDFDFEIRPDKKIEIDHWPAYYQKLLDHLRDKKVVFKVLPYLITRIDLGDFKVELSSPRIELNKENNFSHHHFDAVLDPNLSCEISFRRRDFSINAIGIKLNLKDLKDEIIDPFNGVQDLRNGILKNLSDDFYHDSVRFLRLIRFQIKFSTFNIDSKLLANLSRFNLTKLSTFHFQEELFKSNPGLFLNFFQKLVVDHKLLVPPQFQIWMIFDFPADLKSREEVLGYVFIKRNEDAEKVAKFFSLPTKTLKDLKSFYHSYTIVKATPTSVFKEISSQKCEEALMNPLMRELKNLEDKKVWRDYLHLKDDLLVGWKDWGQLNIHPNELSSVPLALRSFVIYYKAIKKKYENGSH